MEIGHTGHAFIPLNSTGAQYYFGDEVDPLLQCLLLTRSTFVQKISKRYSLCGYHTTDHYNNEKIAFRVGLHNIWLTGAIAENVAKARLWIIIVSEFLPKYNEMI